MFSMKPKNIFLAALLLPTTLFAADEPQAISLWPDGAPGFESRKDIPEQAASYWVKNINNPSLTVFLPPKEKANGAAVVICPGGGFRELVFGAEGVEPAKYFNNLGVAAFVLKYRLFRETNSIYTAESPHEDGLRAMRLVRSRAAEWGVDTNRIGMVGYSAGGEVVSMTTFGATRLTGRARGRISSRKFIPDRWAFPPCCQRIRRPPFCSVPTTTVFMPSWSPICLKNIARPGFRRNCISMRKAAMVSTRGSARNLQPFTAGRNA